LTPKDAELLLAAHTRWYAHNGREFNDAYVPGEGNDVNPLAMIIGEAPGAEEALRGRPFVGPSGLILRQLMAIAELFTGYTPEFGTSNTWLTNVIKFRPPGNRTPFEPEINQVRGLLRKEWRCVGQPRIIIPVGAVALYAVLGERWSVLKTGGQPHAFYSRRIKRNMVVWPMVHPAYAMRNKEYQPTLERDWMRLAAWLMLWLEEWSKY
jgi:uracil-DNA glycosylase